MANVVKKNSISSELAQKMVNAAVAKARELGVTENVAILDDGGNVKAFSRMDGASIPTIEIAPEIAQNKAYTALFGVSTQDFFNFIQGDRSLLAGLPTLSRVAAWGGGFPIKVDGEIVGAIGVSGAPTVQTDVDCAKAALAHISDARTEPARESVMTTLQNQTALVTGASRGIGRATAAALARAGAHVLVHYGRSAQEAESLVSEIQTKGGRASAISADLGTPDGAALLAKKVRSIVGHRLDVLVLNAGISKAAPIADYAVEDFDNLFATNVRGPFFLVQQLLPLFGEGSNIILISSLGARAVVGTPNLDKPSILAYAATKGAIETLVKNWAAILGPRGIRVNAVAPGVIDTDMSNITKTEAGREVALGMQALKRIGKPEDIADVVAFVASDGARWITGASIPVDGGSKL